MKRCSKCGGVIDLDNDGYSCKGGASYAHDPECPPRKEPTAQEFYEKMHDDIYKALCCNRMTGAVADFLAKLAVRVEKLERHEI